MKATILYHANCLDGAMAALMMQRHLPMRVGGVHYSTMFFEAVAYDEAPPLTLCAGTDVYVVDFSYDLAATLDILRVANSMVVLDHHKTAIERFELAKERCVIPADVEDKLDLIFDTTKSGARLAFEYCNPNTKAPWYVAHVEDRDLWKFALPNTKAICASLFQHLRPNALTALNQAVDKGRQFHAIAGEVLQAETVTMVKRVVDTMHMGHVAGFDVPCANAMFVMSEAGHELAKDHPFSMIYYRTPEGFKVSLRSSNTQEDVAAIAQLFGGGGHRNAAGFNCSVEQMAGFFED